jgi:hypothetical protein
MSNLVNEKNKLLIIFARESRPGYSTPCYIGQIENIDERLDDHEKEACAKRNGATHIQVHVTTGGESVRKAEEKDLVQKAEPPVTSITSRRRPFR